jgi:TonB family protein
MDTGHAVSQFGLESRSPNFRPWVLSVLSHGVILAVAVIAWNQTHTAPTHEWRLVSTVDLRKSDGRNASSTSDTLRASAASVSREGVVPVADRVSAAQVAGVPGDLVIPYPDAARRRGEEGVVSAEWSVDAAGTASEVLVTQSSGSRLLDEAVLKAIREHTFGSVLGAQKAQFRFVLSSRFTPTRSNRGGQ